MKTLLLYLLPLCYVICAMLFVYVIPHHDGHLIIKSSVTYITAYMILTLVLIGFREYQSKKLKTL